MLSIDNTNMRNKVYQVVSKRILCGVPSHLISIATALQLTSNTPLLYLSTLLIHAASNGQAVCNRDSNTDSQLRIMTKEGSVYVPEFSLRIALNYSIK